MPDISRTIRLWSISLLKRRLRSIQNDGETHTAQRDKKHDDNVNHRIGNVFSREFACPKASNPALQKPETARNTA